MKTLRIPTAATSIALGLGLTFALAGCASGVQAGASSSDAATSSLEVSASTSLEESTTSSAAEASTSANEVAQSSSQQTAQMSSHHVAQTPTNNAQDTQTEQTSSISYTANDNGIAPSTTLAVADAFTSRDLEQTADTSTATALSLADGKDINISEEGVYVVSGTASESTIIVEAPDTAKVQIVLDNASITNTDFPAIYVKSADKVFVTLVGENKLEVTGSFVADGETNTDAVIFSKDDLCLNGTGSLSVSSTNHAVVSKDDLKVTGGTYTINATAGSAFKANDSVRIADGTFTINASDGIKAKNDDDNELGYVYVKGGSFDINTTDNCIQGYAFVWIDGGNFQMKGAECIEGTYIQINDGSVTIDAEDDGINASIKSSIYTPTIEINGGNITVNMAAGDTDALDSNGYIYINGGTVQINAQSAFDYVWGAQLTGGEVYVNGEQVNEITASMMGGGGRGGFNGQTPPDFENGERPQRPGRGNFEGTMSSQGTAA